MARPKTKKTPKKGWREIVIEAMATGATVTEAAKSAGVVRQTIYAHLQKEPEFQAAYDDAVEQGTDVLEAEATRRAVHGVEEPVIYQGQPTYLYERNADGTIKTRTVNYTDEHNNTTQKTEPIMLLDEQGNPRVLTVRKPSDTLAIFLLKGRRPQKFRDNVDITSGGKAAPVVVIRGVSMDQL